MQALIEKIDFGTLQPHVTQAVAVVTEQLDKHQVHARVTAASITTCTVVGALSLLTYAVPAAYQKLFHGVQDLKKKYNAKWALVTGGSSGIGLALVERLAGQGLNVVVVAYPDETFDKNFNAVVAKFPHLQFRKVAVNLGLVPETFLPAIQKAVADIDVQIVFNNAGYIKTGFFLDVSLEQGLLNHNCNATSAVAITHLLGNQMLNKHLRGCICYTSSPAGFTPTPFTVLYGSTKAFLTEFAMSIAAELSPQGIDVCVVHPSPVASRFYDGAHSLGALNFFKGTATGPDRIAVAVLKSIGRTVVCDQGYYPPVARLLGKVLDITLFADLTATFAGSMSEFKQLLVKRP